HARAPGDRGSVPARDETPRAGSAPGRAARGDAAGDDAPRPVDPRPARSGARVRRRRARDRGRDVAAGGDRAARARWRGHLVPTGRPGEDARGAGRGRRPDRADPHPHDRARAPTRTALTRGPGVRRDGPGPLTRPAQAEARRLTTFRPGDGGPDAAAAWMS